MTFRPERSLKDSGDDRRYPSDGGGANPQPQPVAKISTIYDPRLQCARHPTSVDTTTTLTTTTKTIPVSSPVHHQLPQYKFDPKKSFIEQIKKISHRLHSVTSHSAGSTQPDDEAQKRMRVKKYVCLGVLLACYVAVMVCAWFLIYYPNQVTDGRNFIVDGEFQIMNRTFESEWLDKESAAFKELAFSVAYDLKELFKRNVDKKVAECYQRSIVLEITPNMTVKSILGFRNCDKMNVGRIGLAFLRGLTLMHGHVYLGHNVVNVQSLGFTVRGEEGIWGEWSDWEGCKSSNDTVATRTRDCLTRDTLKVTNVDRCLFIPGDIYDQDNMTCSQYLQMKRQQEMDELVKVVFSNDFNETDEIPFTIPRMEDDIETDQS